MTCEVRIRIAAYAAKENKNEKVDITKYIMVSIMKIGLDCIRKASYAFVFLSAFCRKIYSGYASNCLQDIQDINVSRWPTPSFEQINIHLFKIEEPNAKYPLQTFGTTVWLGLWFVFFSTTLLTDGLLR